MIGSLEPDAGLSGWPYVLAAIWVFALPSLGLIAGCVLAAAWHGLLAWQATAILGGFAAGVAGGVIGRMLTLGRTARRAAAGESRCGPLGRADSARP